jgi:hypothetical protein
MNVPEERDKLIDHGFTLINEHPEKRWALLAKPVGTYIQIAQIPKYGDKVKRTIFTKYEWQKISDLWEEKTDATEQPIQSSNSSS